MAVAHLLLEACFNFLPVTYVLLIPKLNLSYGQIGTLVLGMTIAGTITQPVFGWLSDRLDPRKMIVASILWGGLLMGLVGFMPSYRSLGILLVLAALGSAAFHPPAAALSAHTASRQRGRAMSLFSVGGNLGVALSPALIGIALVVFGLPATGLLIPVSLLTAFVLARRLRFAPATTRYLSRPGETVPDQRAGSMAALLAIILVVASRSYFQEPLMTYLPEWLRTNGQPLPMAGAALSIFMVAVSLGSLFGGSLSDRFGRLPVIAVGLSGMIAGQWVLLQSTGPLQLVAVVIVGVMIGSSYPVTIVLAQEAWPRSVGLASAMVMGL
jgi:FSR family fosmidomycin resistance protein-like MFS transporter